MKRTINAIMGIIFLMVSPFFVYGQILDPVSYSISQSPDQVKAGEAFNVTIHASIDGDWHLYSAHNDPDAGPYATEFSAPDSQLSIAGKINESEPIVEVDPNFNARLGWHTKEATFTVPLKFVKKVSGSQKLVLKVHYQVCNDKVCLPPKSKTISGRIEVQGIAESFNNGRSDSAQNKTGALKSQNSEPTQKVEPSKNSAAAGLGSSGIFSFIWIALTAGFAALLTPCVYPMIPLTVSYFSKNAEEEQRSAVASAFVFGITIVVIFTVLGMLLSIFIGVAGANQFAANPWVNLFIALVLIVFSISLLGAFEIRLPYQLTNWLNRKSNERSGMIGILFMALTISAVSFACTMPFVSALLAGFSRGQWFYPVIGMMAFSAAFASPFVVLAIFPKWLEALPGSGSWMNIVKVLLGFIEFGAAFKFLSNADLVWQWGIISRPFTIACWIALSLLAGLYILRVYSMHEEDSPAHIGTGRLILSMPFILFSLYLIPGLLGASLGIWDSWLPPKQATDVSIIATLAKSAEGRNSGKGTSEVWSTDYQSSIEEAKERSVPLFIDFTGYTCTNCRAMETNVFPLTTIQQQFSNMQQVRLYTDDGADGPENQRFQFKLTGTVALPTYVILDPNNEIILEQLVGYADKDTFEKFLKKGLRQFEKVGLKKL